MEAEVLSAFTKIRHRSEYCDSEQVCSIARGIVRKHKLGATLASEGGANVFSDWWGRCFLRRHGAGVFAPTTTRTATAEQIVAAAKDFYRDVSAVGMMLAKSSPMSLKCLPLHFYPPRYWFTRRRNQQNPLAKFLELSSQHGGQLGGQRRYRLLPSHMDHWMHCGVAERLQRLQRLQLTSELNLFHKTYFIKLFHKLQP